MFKNLVACLSVRSGRRTASPAHGYASSASPAILALYAATASCLTYKTVIHCTSQRRCAVAVQHKTKLTLRLSKRLIAQAKQYAAANDMSVSELVEHFFRSLKPAGEAAHSDLVQELTGLLPPDLDAEQDYRKHLMDRHGQ